MPKATARVPLTSASALLAASEGWPPRIYYSANMYAVGVMAKKSPAHSSTSPHVDEPKVAMSYRLSPAKIARAQRILGTPTATSTIEEALDLVVLRRELIDGVDNAFGVAIADAFPASSRRKRR